ncbi:protein vascular associated death 1 [Anaeramoeba flamelloides]|uniref:Protein vascular associated death 1 n=1 Tax=Anaeramoeba flamelloides TaxID=1746091 RepID=A0AAV7YC24_9EUKA|nr:protein vascular associated death 1 [Anaeramoeba flamelloides]
MIKISTKEKLQSKFDLSTKEPILQQYRCALRQSNGLLRQGWLYLTPLSVIFYSNIFGIRKTIKTPFSKCSMIFGTTFLKFPNSIKITRNDNKESLFFTSFLSRDQCLRNLHKSLKEYKKNEAMQLLSKHKTSIENDNGDHSSDENYDPSGGEDEQEEEFGSKFNFQELNQTKNSQSFHLKTDSKNSIQCIDSEFKEVESETKTNYESKAKLYLETESEIESEIESESETESETKTKTKTRIESEPQTKMEIQSRSEKEYEWELGLDMDSKTEMRKKKRVKKKKKKKKKKKIMKRKKE